MQLRTLLLASTAALVSFAGASYALFQDETMQAPKPGKEHAVLKQMEGEWDATMDFMGMESKGTYTCKVGMGGLWLTQDYAGNFMGQDFTGHGILGYDPAKKKYVGTWIDSMVTSLDLMAGTYDEGKKELTMAQKGVDPASGQEVDMRNVTRFVDKDHMTFEMHVGQPGGEEAAAFTIEYVRKKK